MGIIVDLAIIGCLALCILLGYKKGLTGNLFKLISLIVAIIIAVLLYKPVANAIINNTTIDDNIRTSIINIFERQENDPKKEEKIDGVQNTIINNINKNIQDATTNAKNTIVEESANQITISIINIGSAIIIYLLARIILVIVGIFMQGVTKLPIIKQIDKAGGIAYGIVEGMIIIYVVLGIISFYSIANPNNNIGKAVEESAIGNTLYNNNIIMHFLFK